MSIRNGSLKGMDELDSLEVKALLEDYRLAKRRERASRADFAAGWRAAKLRFEREHSRVAEGRRLKLAV